MADEYYIFALVGKVTKNLHYLPLRITVKVSGGLIGKNDIGIVGECTCDSHSLLLTAREFEHAAVGLVLVKSYAIKELQFICSFW